MTGDEKQEFLSKHFPELFTGLTDTDINNLIITLLQEKVVAEKQINFLIDKLIEAFQQNTSMKDQMLRLTPLLNAVGEGQK